MSEKSPELMLKHAMYGFTLAGFFCIALLVSTGAKADWTDARCDVYPRGEDHTGVVIPCVFSQRQGYINIDRSDGISHDLSPQDDDPGHFRNQKGEDASRWCRACTAI